MRHASLIFIFLLLFTAPLHAMPDDFDHVEIKVTPVTDSLYLLKGFGGNILASTGDDGVLLVDDEFEGLADKVQNAVNSLDSGNVRFVINTHWHGDHTGGNSHFHEEAIIISHANTRRRLSRDQFVEFLNRRAEARPEEELPIITFNQSMSIHFNEEEIQLLHFPNGHTDGDCIVYFTRSNVAHLGDLFFNRRFPFVDLSSGGEIDGLLKNVASILAMLPDDVKIIPGHGPLANKLDLKKYHRVLTETVSHIRAEIHEYEKPLDIIQAEGLKEKYSTWGEGFISTKQWIQLVYEDFHKNDPEKGRIDYAYSH